MEAIRIATAQFEHRSGDKKYNIGQIGRLSALAARLGARAVSFHECSITGYTFARKLSYEQMLELAEPLPGGHRYREARRPGLYKDILGMDNIPEQKVAWLDQ